MDQFSNESQPHNDSQPINESQQYAFSPPPNPYQPPKTNGKSIAGMVLGICSIAIPYIGFIIGIIAIIFSSLSLKEIKRNGDQGRGMAVAGLVCGIIGTALYAIIILAIVLVIAFNPDIGNNYDFSNNSNNIEQSF
ncbi:DUF4190 domain-containing protein [Cohnella faecalis]|uniref:DUF4190 domain-containing protein n=1 Tax=Cohnella faecalis TaxID=2315694 RepID=UPI0026A5D6EF